MSSANCDAIVAPPEFPSLSERRWQTESRFLFVRMSSAEEWQPQRCAAGDPVNIEFSAGRGCTYSATVKLMPSDYAREMAEAVTNTINEVNRRWGLPESAIDGTFTGNKENP